VARGIFLVAGGIFLVAGGIFLVARGIFLHANARCRSFQVWEVVWGIGVSVALVVFAMPWVGVWRSGVGKVVVVGVYGLGLRIKDVRVCGSGKRNF